MPDHGGTAASRVVQVYLFGGLSTLRSERPMVVEVAAGATIAEVIASIGHRLGPCFTAMVMDSAHEKIGICRLFLNGFQVEPDARLPVSGGADLELIVLTASEGG